MVECKSGFEGDVVCITSGANMNFDRLRVLGNCDGGSNAGDFDFAIPEKKPFKRFVTLVGEDTNYGVQIQSSEYQDKQEEEFSESFIFGECRGRRNSSMHRRLRSNGIPTEDFTKDQTTQTHEEFDWWCFEHSKRAFV